jgi:zinc transporter 7
MSHSKSTLFIFCLFYIQQAHAKGDFSSSKAWTYGMISSIGLGVIGFLMSSIVVLLKTKTKFSFAPIIKVLIAFASGALIGDALIHLIPESFGAHGHEEEEHNDGEVHHDGEEEEEHADEEANP